MAGTGGFEIVNETQCPIFWSVNVNNCMFKLVLALLKVSFIRIARLYFSFFEK